MDMQLAGAVGDGLDAVRACVYCNWRDGLGGIGLTLGLGGAIASAIGGTLFGPGGPRYHDAGYPPIPEDGPYDRRQYDSDPNADDVGDQTPRPHPRQAPPLTNVDRSIQDFSDFLHEMMFGEDRPPGGRGGTRA